MSVQIHFINPNRDEVTQQMVRDMYRLAAVRRLRNGRE